MELSNFARLTEQCSVPCWQNMKSTPGHLFVVYLWRVIKILSDINHKDRTL